MLNHTTQKSPTEVRADEHVGPVEPVATPPLPRAARLRSRRVAVTFGVAALAAAALVGLSVGAGGRTNVSPERADADRTQVVAPLPTDDGRSFELAEMERQLRLAPATTDASFEAAEANRMLALAGTLATADASNQRAETERQLRLAPAPTTDESFEQAEANRMLALAASLRTADHSWEQAEASRMLGWTSG